MRRLHLRPAGETNRSRKLRTQWLAAALSACWTLPAAARSAGSETDNCTGCHTTASDATAMLVASPADFSPGTTVDFTLTVSRPNLSSAGYYIATDIGTLTPGAGSRLGTFGMSLLHNAPVAAVGGTSTVHFKWQAPAEPGGVDVKVTAVAANGDGRSSGDAAFDQTFSFVYGCTGVPVFQDLDGDQVGSSEYGVSLRCGTETGWAELDGDCNENNAEIHPGAAEICNGKDDDCNGETDEGIDLATLYRDADGDGYGAGESVAASGGCDNSGEFAAQGGDCDDADPEVFPDATEQCNEADDNCDGRVDERVRPRCGVGRCESLSISCLSEDCVPGSPSPETCNLLDDDCDGEVDEAADGVCPTGEVCLSGACSSATSPPVGTATGAASSVTAPPPTNDASNPAPTDSAAPGANTAGTIPPAPEGSTTSAAPNASAVQDPGPADSSASCAVRGQPTALRLGGAWLSALLGLLYWRRVLRRY